MNISKQNIDELNATLTMKVSKEDYQERVAKVLGDYRKKANLPGFRPGKVPASLISKMYGKAVLADEINKLVGEKLNEYIKAEDIHVLGDPMPNENQNKQIDFENDTEFEFVFDIGLSPELDVNISKKDKITAYEIKLEDSMIDNYVNNYTRRYGKFIECDVVEENEMLKGDFAEVDDAGNIVENGIASQDISVYLEIAKDENEKKAFKGAKIGDIVKFDVKKAFPNDTEIANLLKVDKDKVADAPSKYQFTIKSISKFQSADLNTELFDKIYGEGKVNSEEEFKNKITDELKENLKKDTNYKFQLDSRKFLLKKNNVKLPEEFLKRWLTFMNEGKITPEQIEKEFPVFVEDMKWQLIKNKIAKLSNIEVKEDEVVEYAKEVTRMQFRQYGLSNIPDEHIDSYAVNLLKKEDEVRRLVDKLLEDKVVNYVKETVTPDVKEISNEEFSKLFSEN